MTTTLLPTTSTSTTSTTTTSTTTTSTTTTSTTTTSTTTAPSPCGTNFCTSECKAYLREKIYDYQKENEELNKKIKETNNALKPKNDYVTILKKKYYNYKSKNPPTTMLDIEKRNRLIMMSIDGKLNFLEENKKTLSVAGKNFYEQQIQFEINCMLLSVAEVEYNNFLWAAPESNKNSLAAYEKEIEKLKNDRDSFNDTLNLNNDQINAYDNIIATCDGKDQANANCSFNDKACFSSETDYHDAVVNAAIGCVKNITRVNPDLQSF